MVVDPTETATITVPAGPSPQEAELLRRFTVTHHYLRHLAIYFEQTYGRNGHVFAGIAAQLGHHRPYLRIQRRAGTINHENLRRHLEIAWISELQLWVPAVIGQKRPLALTRRRKGILSCMRYRMLTGREAFRSRRISQKRRVCHLTLGPKPNASPRSL